MEMESLNPFDMRQLVLDCAEEYEITMIKEIDLMTAIIDPVLNQVKTGETQNELKRKLCNLYQVYSSIKEVERPIIDRIIAKSGGNPQYSLGLIYQMIVVSIIRIIRFRIISST